MKDANEAIDRRAADAIARALRAVVVLMRVNDWPLDKALEAVAQILENTGGVPPSEG